MSNASFYTDFFNTREKAVIIWLLIFLVWVLSQKNIRSSLCSVIKALFQRKILVLIMAMLFYTSLTVFILSKIGIWEVSLIKDTIIWVFGSAFVLLMNLNKATQDEHHFKKIFFDNLKLILIIEFIINLYAFSLWIELILVPVLFVIIAMSAFVEMKKEYMSVKKVIDFILSAFIILLIVFALVKILGDYQAFASPENLRVFTLPPLLTFSYIPFLYLFALVIAYENLFVRFDIFLKKDQKLAKLAKQKVFALCHVNLGKLNRFSKESTQDLMKMSSRDDMLNMIENFKNICRQARQSRAIRQRRISKT